MRSPATVPVPFFAMGPGQRLREKGTGTVAMTFPLVPN